MRVRALRLQCPTCPWRVGTDPERDIPDGYCAEKHAALRGTIAEPGALPGSGPLRIMACHYSRVGSEVHCAGWLHHQLGVGNNLALRLEHARGRAPTPRVRGEQHPTFDDTLPRRPAQ
jgi:hypothetical protein